MTLNEYQSLALSTAIYPREYAIIYPALKLAGECGEVAEKALSCSALCFLYKVESKASTEMLKEIGDCLWYIAALAHDCSFTLAQVCAITPDSGVHATEADVDFSSVRWPPAEHAESWLVILLASYSGAVAEITGKALRDTAASFDLERRIEIAKHLSGMLSCLNQLASHYDSTLNEAAEMNIAKLKSRQERGVLQGSGDNR